MKNIIFIILLFTAVVGNAQTYIKGKNLIEVPATTATAAGTTTLTNASQTNQQFTGSTTQTVVLPNATTLKKGNRYFITNRSSGVVTVNFNGGSLAQAMAAGTEATFILENNATAAGTWDLSYFASGGSGSVTAIITGIGLVPNTITSTGTLVVDVGTTANKIVQLTSGAQYPAVDGFLITNLNGSNITNINAANKALSNLANTAMVTNLNFGAASTYNITNVNAIQTNQVISQGDIDLIPRTNSNSVYTHNRLRASTAGLFIGQGGLPFDRIYLNEIRTSGDSVVFDVANGVVTAATSVTTPLIQASADLDLNPSGNLNLDPTGGNFVVLYQDLHANGPRSIGASGSSFNKGYFDFIQNVSDDTVLDTQNYLLSQGGTTKIDFSGTNVSLNTRKLTNVVDPSAAQDAATKNYVDTHGGTGTVTSIVSGTGLVPLTTTTTGTINVDVGTTVGKIVQVATGNKYPAIDGNAITNINAVKLQTFDIATTTPTAGTVLTWNSTTTKWEPKASTAGTVTQINTGNGIVPLTITGTGTLVVDTGTTANKIVQITAGTQYPDVDGNLITNINAVKLQTFDIATTTPTAGTMLAWNSTTTKWEPKAFTSGTVTQINTGTGLVGLTITSTGTLAVDVGTTASKIVQITAGTQYPAVDGNLISNVNAVKLQTFDVASGFTPTTNNFLGWNNTTSKWEPRLLSAGNAFVSGGNAFAGNVNIGLTDNFNLGVITSNSSRMTVDWRGYVGIGNTAPTATVDLTGNMNITSSFATALTIGQNGATNPAFQVDSSAASSITGIKVTSIANAGQGPVIAAISSNAVENINVASKGSTSSVNLRPNGNTYYQFFVTRLSLAPDVSTNAAQLRFLYLAAADTNLTTTVDATAAQFDMSNIRQHATGAITSQRDMRITPGTHSFVGASTITDAMSLSVDGPPTGGTNATITNSSALYVLTRALANTTNGYGLNVNAPTGATNNYAAILTGGNVGMGVAAPTSKLHLDGGNATASAMKVTAGTTTGTTATDGIDFGIDASGNGVINQRENLDIIVSTNNAEVMRFEQLGNITFPNTITAGGTTGNQTINKISGTVNIAAAGTTVTVTDSLVGATSICFAVARTNDATCGVKNVVPAAGSFVITTTAACTAETSFGFWCIN